MAESDPLFTGSQAEAAPPPRAGKARRIAVMVSVPLLLFGGAAWYYIANDHYVSTDNAYVQQDKVSVSAQVTGEIVEVHCTYDPATQAPALCFKSAGKLHAYAPARARARC